MFGFPKQKLDNIRVLDLWALALRIFRVRPFRTILTILGIGISFATIFFLLSLGYGLQNILLSQISSEESLRTLDVYSPNSSVLPLNDGSIREIAKIEHIEKLDPIIVVSGQVEMADIAAEANFQGLSPEFFKSLQTKILEGRVPRSSNDEVVLSTTMAQILGDGVDFLGKEIRIILYVPEVVDEVENVKVIQDEKTYKIVGIADDESNSVFIPFEKISGHNLPYGLVKILTDSTKTLEGVRIAIADKGYTVSSVVDTVDQANKIFSIFQFILALFGAAALVVAVIGMINTMTISLLERINEIGIMKIFGISQGDVERLFILESTIIGFLGGASGLAMGFLLSRIFNFGIGILARTLGGRPVELFYYPGWFVVSILVFSSVVGIITGFSPARKAANLDPLEALNYK